MSTSKSGTEGHLRPAWISRGRNRDSVCMVLPSASLRELVLRSYVRRGWKYFVMFRDVGGFGLQGARLALWQDENSSVSVQR